MVKFRNFSRDGDMLESDVFISDENCIEVKFHAKFNMKSREMEYTGNISQFVYNQCFKGFIDIVYNIREKNRKYKKDFDVVWG